MASTHTWLVDFSHVVVQYPVSVERGDEFNENNLKYLAGASKSA